MQHLVLLRQNRRNRTFVCYISHLLLTRTSYLSYLNAPPCGLWPGVLRYDTYWGVRTRTSTVNSMKYVTSTGTTSTVASIFKNSLTADGINSTVLLVVVLLPVTGTAHTEERRKPCTPVTHYRYVDVSLKKTTGKTPTSNSPRTTMHIGRVDFRNPACSASHAQRRKRSVSLLVDQRRMYVLYHIELYRRTTQAKYDEDTHTPTPIPTLL